MTRPIPLVGVSSCHQWVSIVVVEQSGLYLAQRVQSVEKRCTIRG
jgi:hypothetical protein